MMMGAVAKSRIVRPMEGDKIDDSPCLPQQAPMQEVPYSGAEEAAAEVLSIIKSANKTGYLWIRSTDHHIKIAGESYRAASNEIFVGAYDANADYADVVEDIKDAAFNKSRKRRTRKITHVHSVTETVETETLEPSKLLADAAPEAAEIQQAESPPEEKAPESTAAEPETPDPSAYDAILCDLESRRERLDADIGIVKIFRIMHSKEQCDRLAFLLDDYSKMLNEMNVENDEALRSCCDDALTFAAIFSAPRPNGWVSIIDHAAKYLRSWACCQLDCSAGCHDKSAEDMRRAAHESAQAAALLDGENIPAQECE